VFERTKQRHTKVVWVYASIVSALHANTIMLIKDKEQNTQKRLKVLNGLVTTLSEKTEMLKIRETFISTLQRVNRDVLQSRDALQAKLVGVVLAKQTADALAQATTKKLELITAKNAQLVTFTATLKTMLGKLPQL
jgi:prolyl-tRNA synthetase